MKKLKWGILGSGKIATIFSTALKTINNAEIYGVASRNPQEMADSGQRFTAQFGCSVCYDSFDQLLQDDNIDIIYIALPHSVHETYVLEALKHNKHVLCEKPIGINAKQVHTMKQMAEEKHLFLMEGMWTKFLPVTKEITSAIESDKIGKVRHIHVSFGFKAPGDDNSRFKNPALAGGSLLDVGVYTIAYANMIMKNHPSRILSMPFIGKSGVDYSASILMEYEPGVNVELTMSFEAFLANQAVISGDQGVIIVDSFFGAQKAKIITQYGQNIEEIDIPHKVNGYEYQAQAVTDAVLSGKTWCDEMTLVDSLQVVTIMDQLRNDWGLVYPMESP